MMRIETVTGDTFEKVLSLIADYQRFYGCTPDEAKNRAYFSRFIDDQSQGVQFVALDDDDEACGFATLYFMPSSLSAQTACTFNDLYAVPGQRGQGVALALGFHALRYARDLGFGSVSWLTRPTNAEARRIYDGLLAKRSEWLMYEVSLTGG
jgi:GNAT superfamily N-acetyltransferase